MALLPLLQFPLDRSQINYEATVTFQAVELEAVDVSSIFRGGGKVARPINSPEDAIAAGRAEIHAVGYTSDAQMQGDDASVQTLAGTGQRIKKMGSKATLYLPQAIQITDGAAYDNIDLGIMGSVTEAGMAAGASVGSAIADSVVEGVSSFVQAFTGGTALSGNTGRLAVTRAANFLPSEAARGAVRSGTRVSVNPNTRALFKSVPLREFTFTFKMIPTSKKETDAIKAIIKFFRTELYPEVFNIGSTDIPGGYKFPNVFEISMYYKDIKNGLATKILPSYLRNFSATYNSSGMGFLEGGDFTEVDVSMTFIESSTLHKELVKDGGY